MSELKSTQETDVVIMALGQLCYNVERATLSGEMIQIALDLQRRLVAEKKEAQAVMQVNGIERSRDEVNSAVREYEAAMDAKTAPNRAERRRAAKAEPMKNGAAAAVRSAQAAKWAEKDIPVEAQADA